MRVGVVTTSYPRFLGDPAGSFVEAHVQALRALGHTVDVIAAGPHDDAATRIPSSLFYEGGAPDQLEHAPLRASLAAATFLARLAHAVHRRATRWDSVVAHWLVPSALAALPLQLPLLAIAHGGDVHTLRRHRLLRPMLHALHRRGAQLAFVARELQAHAITAAPALASWLGAQRVQPMGVDTARFAAIARAPTSPPTLLVAARLVPVKGVDVAIEAFARLRIPARLVIAGDGPQRARLAQRAARDPRIELVGQVDTRARDHLLGAASAVIVPSRVLPNGRTEGAPLIALEALATGVPVIASHVGGLCDLPLVHVPPEDPAALAAAIAHTLAAPPLPDILRQHVAELDWQVVARRLVRSE